MRRAASGCMLLLLLLCGAALGQRGSDTKTVEDVEKVVEQFESGLQERDLKRIEAVVAEDLVAFENGHRNDGWADFRDNHLVPEMKEPAPAMTPKIVKLRADGKTGWAYTQAQFSSKRSNGDTVQYELWSIYVLEKRVDSWKIVLLDWSLRAQRPKP